MSVGCETSIRAGHYHRKFRAACNKKRDVGTLGTADREPTAKCLAPSRRTGSAGKRIAHGLPDVRGKAERQGSGAIKGCLDHTMLSAVCVSETSPKAETLISGLVSKARRVRPDRSWGARPSTEINN